MSHFSVLVVGPDVDRQLAPFDENIEVPRYMLHTKAELIENTRREIEGYAKTTYAEYLSDPKKYAAGCTNPGHLRYLENEFPLKLKWTESQMYADAVRFYKKHNIGPKGEVYSTRNPQAKWDWHQVGGRFSDRLVVLKGQNTANSAPKGLVDWSKVHLSKSLLQENGRYWDLAFKKVRPTAEEAKWFWERPEYLTRRYKNRQNYARCNASFSTWAAIIGGVWYEKGDMGWWGLSDETDEAAVRWDLGFYDRFVAPLPNDALLTIVDCHI